MHLLCCRGGTHDLCDAEALRQPSILHHPPAALQPHRRCHAACRTTRRPRAHQQPQDASGIVPRASDRPYGRCGDGRDRAPPLFCAARRAPSRPRVESARRGRVALSATRRDRRISLETVPRDHAPGVARADTGRRAGLAALASALGLCGARGQGSVRGRRAGSVS